MEWEELQQQAAECLAQDKYDSAVCLYEECIEAAPNEMSSYWLLGLALLLADKELEAISVWLQVMVEGNSSLVEVLTAELIKVLEAEALKRLRKGKYAQAEKIYWQIIELNPTHAEAYKNLGNALGNQGNLEEAQACYQQALALGPNCAITYYNVGYAFERQGKISEAIASYQQAIVLEPNYAEAYNNLGTVLANQGKLDEAIASYQQCLTLNPKAATAYYNLGHIFEQQQKVEEAIASYQQAIALEPNYAEAYNNLGNVLENQDKLEEAIPYYQQALILDPNYPEAHLNCGLILLRRGEYERGFAEYEWRWRMEKMPPRLFTQPLWSGEELQGRTILLHAEQGFGDTIQFIRYAPIVQQRGGIVVVECQQPLVRLLTTVAGINKVVAYGTTLPEFDVHAPLLSLPYILGTTLETVPAQIPYLHPPEFSNLRISPPPGTRLKVGIVWSGSAGYIRNHKRSCSLSHFLELLNIPDIAFYSLQKEPQVLELAELADKIRLQDLSSWLDDFATTASVMAQLDLIVTVDTAVAHLAGALGRPVWLLLSFVPDWRWMIGRSDSPWYPTMRLFRQKQPGDWAELLRRVIEALLLFRDYNNKG